MPGFADAYNVVLRHELGKVDHPADPGGRTKDGVTQRTYDAFRRAHGASVRDVYLMSDAERQAIYLQYWNASGAAGLPWPLALVHFDAFINHAPSTARGFLQTAAGDTTRYLDAREAYFQALATRTPARRVFLRGWINRVNNLRSLVAAATQRVTGSQPSGPSSSPPMTAGVALLVALASLVYFVLRRRGGMA